MAKILDIRARQVWDSRGRPTVEAEVIVGRGTTPLASGRAIAPAGASTGSGEAKTVEVREAVRNIQSRIRDGLRALSVSDQEKLERLETLRTWEHPHPGSYYDQVGDRSKAPHVVVGDLKLVGEGLPSKTRIPEILWWDKGYSRKKPAWMVVLSWPEEMRYDKLDPNSRYVIRTTGNGTCRSPCCTGPRRTWWGPAGRRWTAVRGTAAGTETACSCACRSGCWAT